MELNELPKFGPVSYQKSIKEIMNNQEKEKGNKDDEDNSESYVEDDGPEAVYVNQQPDVVYVN
jgi:hypothetical protein